MIRKCELRSRFEADVKNHRVINTPVGVLDILTWLITLDEKSKTIRLNAVTRLGLVCSLKSYPFRSVTSAYQFMVRL